MKGASKNNQFWKLRSKHGRDKIFESPQALWSAACEYFEWVDTNPLKEEKVFGTGKKLSEKKMRAYTLSGLCFYLKCSDNTLRSYGKEEQYKEFHEVVEWIDQVVYTQKFTGAAAGLLDSRIISRDLGLVDKQIHEIGPKTKTDLSHLTNDELKLYYELQRKIENGQSDTTRVIQAPRVLLHNGIEQSETHNAGTGIDAANG